VLLLTSWPDTILHSSYDRPMPLDAWWFEGVDRRLQTFPGLSSAGRIAKLCRCSRRCTSALHG
jgi:hypothetical protein